MLLIHVVDVNGDTVDDVVMRFSVAALVYRGDAPLGATVLRVTGLEAATMWLPSVTRHAQDFRPGRCKRQPRHLRPSRIGSSLPPHPLHHMQHPVDVSRTNIEVRRQPHPRFPLRPHPNLLRPQRIL